MNKFFMFCIVCLLSGCSNLVQDTYKYTNSESIEEAHTAFIILSNIELTESDLVKIKKDYSDETDLSKKFFYEYLLAKRTQEEKYILSFIENSESNSSTLLNNTSNWVSIGSPTLDLLAIYSKTNDDALSVLLKLVLDGDGANQSIVASNLHDAYEINPDRFIKITKQMDLDINDILFLMEDE